MRTEVLTAVLLLAAAYCAGGLNGLWLAWTQEARMAKWAAKVEAVHVKLMEIEERGNA